MSIRFYVFTLLLYTYFPDITYSIHIVPIVVCDVCVHWRHDVRSNDDKANALFHIIRMVFPSTIFIFRRHNIIYLIWRTYINALQNIHYEVYTYTTLEELHNYDCQDYVIGAIKFAWRTQREWLKFLINNIFLATRNYHISSSRFRHLRIMYQKDCSLSLY